MRYILTSPSCIPSAKLLRNALQELTGNKILVSARPIERTKNKKYQNEILVRYGNSVGTTLPDTGLNAPAFIHLISSKKLLADTLLNNGIHAPVFTKDISSPTFPLIVRETLTSFGGRGIHLVNSSEELQRVWRSNFWATAFINMSQEFRVHIANGEVLRIFEKIPNEEGLVIKNNASCHFSLREPEGKFKKLFELIEQLNQILGTRSFYALDVGWDKDKRQYFVIEGNSAPGLNENSAGLYGKKITEILGK